MKVHLLVSTALALAAQPVVHAAEFPHAADWLMDARLGVFMHFLPGSADALAKVKDFDVPAVNFTVEKNVVGVSHYHGVSVYDAQGCTIQDNVCFSHEATLRPWVMLGQKSKQARGNTVRNNLAHSFNFKHDPEVKAENNLPVTEGLFLQKRAELATFIDRKFGSTHPTAKRPRFEPKPAQQ